jgi:hypothetical protein
LKALYETTVQDDDSSWGTYVSIEQIKTAFGSDNDDHNNNKDDWLLFGYDPQQPLEEAVEYSRDDLALRCVAAYLYHVLKAVAGGNTTTAGAGEPATGTTVDDFRPSVLCLLNHGSFDYISASMLLTQDAHVVAIWALASEPGSQVPYHLDYADQVCYESNVIVPPILSGTLQCTPAVVKGGTYCVHTDGLRHYEKHGYKGNKSQYPDALFEERKLNNSNGGWIEIPFRTNRMILQLGHLPHLSTTVESVEPATAKRVIVGFNVFRHHVGPFVQRAPEHLETFRRKVALQRLLLRLKTNNNINNNKDACTVQAVRSNSWLAKLLVRDKRQRVKEEFLQAQADLDKRIDDALFLRRNQQTAATTNFMTMTTTITMTTAITVQALMDAFGRSDGLWPNAQDVLVHIQRRCRQGRWRIVVVSNDDDDQETDPVIGECCHILLSPDSRIGLARTVSTPPSS